MKTFQGHHAFILSGIYLQKGWTWLIVGAIYIITGNISVLCFPVSGRQVFLCDFPEFFSFVFHFYFDKPEIVPVLVLKTASGPTCIFPPEGANT